ncbi:MAG: GNAT family N-acetyltransferase [Legionella sp.]|uniref:GNAT family N-acetyltransferase n=1 Tax=Legionella sp. TaxID=459 RepID=UPI0039E5AA87
MLKSNRVNNDAIKIDFRSITFSDIPLMFQWFNTPHVQKFYSLRSWTEEEVLAKLAPYICGDKPVSGFIISLDENPIGYLQSYQVSDYPWPNQNLAEEIVRSAMGMDLFIGNEGLLGKGLGQQIIRTFIEAHVCPQYRYCIVDPDLRNVRAIQCYRKLKFKEHQVIDTEDALQHPTKLMLMIIKCA